MSGRSLQSFDFNDHVIVAGAAISLSVERALLVLAGELGFEGGVEAVDSKVQLQEGEC